jgi:hypothetical protein
LERGGGFVYENDGRQRAGFLGAPVIENICGLIFSLLLFSTTWPGLFLALFFQASNVFNNFSALFLGSFRFVFGARSCVFNKFSASFFKKGILFLFLSLVSHKNARRRPP